MMKEDHNTDVFPKHFFWGASTAGHQVEGGNSNQWTVWEQHNAKELAQTAHQRLGWLPNWSEVKKQAEARDNYISGDGVQHYSRYEADFDIVKGLNLNAFRFGIEWSRIEPREGEWDEAEVAHYREYIAQLRARGIEPFANIWHWTFPVWFAEQGGFAKRSNIKYFERFVQKLADELVDDLGYIITLNEPNVYASFGYLSGEWVPNQKNPLVFLKVYRNLYTAHRRAYRILKRQKPSLQIGIAHQLGNIQAKRPHNVLDQTSTRWMRYFWNWWFINRIRKQQDFVGINYYFTDYYTGAAKKINPSVPINDLGWYMEPEGLYPLLLSAWNRYKKPIFVTENGLADAKDEYRRWWLEETIVAMERALSEGVDLRGYLHWSLLDNFEWKYGWWPQFGLVHVDRKTMKRTVRPSAKWFAARIKDITQK
jgi:beta-glucosidase